MQNTELETTQHLVLAGKLGFGSMALVILILFAVILLVTWQEARYSGRRWLFFLVPLRLIALLTVIWMLAGPAIETVVKQQRRRVVNVMVDTSASMSIIDPMDKAGNGLRWAAFSNEGAECHLLKQLDDAAGSLSSARSQFGKVVAMAERNGKVEGIAEAAERLADCAGETEGKLQGLVHELRTFRSDAQDEMNEIQRRILESVSQLRQASAQFKSKSAILTPERIDSLNEPADVLGGIAARLANLGDITATHYADGSDPKVREAMRSYTTKPRLEKFSALLEQAESKEFSDIGKKAEIRRYRFDSAATAMPGGWEDSLKSANPTSEKPSAMSTNLAAALEQIHRDTASESVAAALLLTDGGHNDAQDPLKVASSLNGLPLYIVPIGNVEPLRDVILYQAEAPRSVFLKDSISIEATVDAYLCAGEKLKVALLENNQPIENRELTVKGDSFSERVVFSPPANTLGTHEYTLRVEEIARENVSDNNSTKLSVDVVEDRLRILLADNLPRWEYRYLRNLFKRDEHTEHTDVLFEPRAPGTSDIAEGTGFPRDLDGWNRYSVVILGDLAPATLPVETQKMLQEFVSRRGGSLIIIAGDDYMPAAYMNQPLAEMLPVEDGGQEQSRSGYTLYVTNEGSAMPATQLSDDPLQSERLWREQLPVFGISRFARPKSTAHMIIGASPRTQGQQQAASAFLCWQQVGSGRVIYISAPLTYRLRYMHGDSYHHRFWGQLMRWAIARDISGGSKTVRLNTDKIRYQAGEEAQVTARLYQTNGTPYSGAKVRAIARRENRSPVGAVDLEPDKDAPGVYRGILKGLPLGQISVGVDGVQVQALLQQEGFKGAVETNLRIEPPAALELRNTRCNLPLLSKIAEAAGGQIIPPTGLAAALKQIDLSPEITESRSQRPVWDKWLYLWIFLGCLTVEWVVRKRTGLP